jgi:hypothetical protein
MSKYLITIFLVLFIHSISPCQIKHHTPFLLKNGVICLQDKNDNKKAIDTLLHWDIFVKGGITRHLGGHTTTVSYIEFGAAYFFNKFHEAGIAIGQNKFTSGSTLELLPHNDTLPVWFLQFYTKIWYSAFYTFHYKEWNAGIKFGFIEYIKIGVSDMLSNLSMGRDVALNKGTYLNIGLNYAFISDRILGFREARFDQVTISFSLGFRL